MVKKTILWILVIATCIAIFTFSSMEGKYSDKHSEAVSEKVESIVIGLTDKKPSANLFTKIHLFVRKQGHFTEFALLGLLVFLLTRCYDLSLKKSFIITLSFVLFYGCTDEIHQLFVRGRAGCVKDVFIDFFGGCVGTLLATIPELIKIKKQSKNL